MQVHKWKFLGGHINEIFLDCELAFNLVEATCCKKLKGEKLRYDGNT